MLNKYYTKLMFSTRVNGNNKNGFLFWLYQLFSSHQESFQKYITSLPKTKLIRNTKREGLIRSRMIGAEASVSPVVVFLDAHTECNEGWIEPLLQELLDHPATITQPFVDNIDASSIAYAAAPGLHKGAFSWDLRYVLKALKNLAR